MQDPADEFDGLAVEIAQRAQAAGLTIAAAESLTTGAISNALGAAPEASEWLRGGIVAYAEGVKRDLVGVTAEKVASAQCARELASGVARLLGADAAVAVTGVGGPGPDEDEPPGSVYAATSVRGEIREAHWQFEGDPSEVVHRTAGAALALLRDALPPATDA